MDFESIYNTVRLDELEPNRPLRQVKCVLAKAYELASLPLFEENPVFDTLEDSPFAIHRTTVARLLLEIDRLPSLNGGLLYTIASRSLELTIDHLHTTEIVLKQLPGTNHEHYGMLVFAGQLRANLRYLIEIARHGVISTNQNAILQQLDRITDNTKKVVHLKRLMLDYKQRKGNFDQQQYVALYSFMKLEKKKWELSFEDSTPYFSTATELLDFVSKLLITELEYFIRKQGGYKNFWRDEQCTVEKKETEVQQYILSILTPACQQKSIKIHREVHAADGSIDMTFTYLNLNVCMEIKKAHHPNVSKAISKQLVQYMQAEKTTAGIYLVLWYKSNKGIKLPTQFLTPHDLSTHLKTRSVSGFNIETHVIDCTKPISPSKKQ